MMSANHCLGVGIVICLCAAAASGATGQQAPPKPAAAQAAPDRNPTRALATKAFDAFTQGLGTGNWQAFFDLMSDDFTFTFPTGKYLGTHAGKATAMEFFGYVSKVYPEGLKVTLDKVTVDGSTAIFEFRDEGTLVLPSGRQPYKNRVAVSMDFKDGKLVAYREYFGSDGKSY